MQINVLLRLFYSSLVFRVHNGQFHVIINKGGSGGGGILAEESLQSASLV